MLNKKLCGLHLSTNAQQNPHESARMHGKCVTATESCRTDPFLVVLRAHYNEHKKGYGGRGGKGGMQGIHARKLKTKNRRDKEKDTGNNAQCSIKRAQGYDGEKLRDK